MCVCVCVCVEEGGGGGRWRRDNTKELFTLGLTDAAVMGSKINTGRTCTILYSSSTISATLFPHSSIYSFY